MRQHKCMPLKAVVPLQEWPLGSANFEIIDSDVVSLCEAISYRFAFLVIVRSGFA